MTIHQAKNREFDNVFVVWPYTVPADSEYKRRLLYNAITRSRANCMVLVRGNLKRIQADDVLRLIGQAKEAFPSTRRKTRVQGRS